MLCYQNLGVLGTGYADLLGVLEVGNVVDVVKGTDFGTVQKIHYHECGTVHPG